MKFTSSAIVGAAVALASVAAASPIEAVIARAANASSTAASSPSSTGSNNSTSTSSDAFPTDVGYPGKGRDGQVPFLVETDRLAGSRGNSPYENRFNATDADKEEFDLFKSLGNVSPYHSSRLFPETTAHKVLPETCSVKQAHIFHRHGARYPTSYTTEGAPFAGATLTNWTKAGNLTVEGPLSFLKNYTYKLGAEYLVPIGAQQLFDSGVYHQMQYGKLLNETLNHKPVIRTPSQARMLNSSRYWTLGFFGWDAPQKINLEVIIESDGFNNTLAPYDTCEASNTVDIGDKYLRPIWDKIYLKDAVKRLQKYTNLPLTTELVYGFQSLCPYESAGLGYSEFCKLFTRDEWEGFDYDLSLQFQGDYGFGGNGRAQGIGWAQELLDRLQNSSFTGPVTTQNTTFDENPTYFPVDQPLYVDFTHDDVIVSVLTALNYTQLSDSLDPYHRDPHRKFRLSEVTPFAARLIFEVIECNDSSNKHGHQSQHYIRTLLNEAVVPMDKDQGCSKARDDGMCGLQDFVNYQKDKAYEASHFVKDCFGKNGTDWTITGPSIKHGSFVGGR
ncbi:unnamed protein product [Sympodiomycopsis kandeliae]